jgi:hypothetical protein
MSQTVAGVVKNGVVVPNVPLPEGATVEVIVLLPEKPVSQRLTMLQLLESLPPGPRAFPTWEEYEKHLQAEKDAWDR